MVAQAGTPVAEIEAALAEENQRLAFEPMDHRALLGTEGTPTIGGVMAANVSGPRRIAVGAARDFALGVRFVDGAGTVIKNGGRVMKNVTGYDLVKLLCGSYGTLGVLTEVSLKVLPAVETTATLIWEGMGIADAVSLFSSALGSPFDVTGAARLPAYDSQPARVMLRLEGFADSVTYRTTALTRHLGGPAPDRVETAPEASAALWRAVRDVTPFADAPGDIWRLSIKPSDLPTCASGAADDYVIDWGGGLVWARVPEGRDKRAEMAGVDGHATVVRGGAGLTAFHPEPAPVAALAAGLRAKFDPRGILNAGLMG